MYVDIVHFPGARAQYEWNGFAHFESTSDCVQIQIDRADGTRKSGRFGRDSIGFIGGIVRFHYETALCRFVMNIFKVFQLRINTVSVRLLILLTCFHTAWLDIILQQDIKEQIMDK